MIQIKLIDFGLAKYLDKTGQAKVSFSGTVGFMAPEIARCQTKGSDFASPASDMFSLGVVIYMLVSGGYEPFWDGSDIRFTFSIQTFSRGHHPLPEIVPEWKNQH